jgi:ribonuclease BN (tRNA processing enzyme)
VHQPGTPACALRIELADRTIAYTGDTDWTDELVDLSRNADLLIAESYFFDRIVPTHLSYGELLAHHSELSARRIIITHMSPDMLARQTEAAERAHDGLIIDIVVCCECDLEL